MSAGSAKTDLRVHVGAVHVNQSSGGVDFRADLLDGFLEDAMGRRIRDHQRGESLPMFVDLSSRSARSMLPQESHATGDDLHAGHGGACGIGSVRGSGNKTDVRGRYPRAIGGMRG